MKDSWPNLSDVQYIWNLLPQWWKHNPTIYHGLIQIALEKGETLEHLQYADCIIVWGNAVTEIFGKEKKKSKPFRKLKKII